MQERAVALDRHVSLAEVAVAPSSCKLFSSSCSSLERQSRHADQATTVASHLHSAQATNAMIS